jgi:hypothetical protein
MPITVMAARPKLNVSKFPRPPLLELTPRHLVIRWNGQTLADTKAAYWVLETTHPPSEFTVQTPSGPEKGAYSFALPQLITFPETPSPRPSN